MDSMKYKDFNRVPPKPPPRAKTYEYCPEEPEPPPPPGRFCKVPLKKHPSGHTITYKMLRVCPRVDYRAELCQPIVICDSENVADDCNPKPKIRKKLQIDDDDSWLLPIPKPPRCPDSSGNPCASDNIVVCRPPIPEYDCGKDGQDD